ncbi:MAG: Spx/MgsR family RNA polymerase-binding regulatory protein [Xanthomonadales bacterium]|nr:Spx/MgsR family RNA polymerase-binding regulatory protein [Xanthomonadales bacterium]
MPVKHSDLLLVFGLKNCDNCATAQAWLKEHAVGYEFRDIGAEGVDKERLQCWLDSSHAHLLINRRSTTWRTLTPEEKELSESNPLKILGKHSTLIKRPVLERHGHVLLLGFSADEYRKHLLS